MVATTTPTEPLNIHPKLMPLPNDQRRKWATIWVGWGVYFATAEYVALRSGHPNAPLSSHLRTILGAKKKSRHTRAGQLIAAASIAWLADHLYRGGNKE
jgi:hypothetical protein